MTGTDSVNTRPPYFGPTRPHYPALEQLVRVAGPALAKTTPAVYPGFVAQWVPPLALRDREACYVVEPNGVALGPAYYDCRLVGSYLDLPLYATTCCPGGGFSSSSSSSAAS